MHEKLRKISYCTGRCPIKPLVYVLKGEQGDLLIDTGNHEVTHQIDRWIKRNNFNIKWIFLTHGHFDHTWNALYFRQKYGAKVILHEKDRGIFCTLDKRKQNATSEKQREFARQTEEIIANNPAPFCKIDYFLTDDDGDFLRKLGFDADVIMLPGHTEGSMGIKKGKVIYVGDAVSAVRGDYYEARTAENLEGMHESDKKIFDLNPVIIAPGHGQLIINERAF